MLVRFITPGGVETSEDDALPTLLERTDGFVWLDIASWDSHAAALLDKYVQAHPKVIDACAGRNHVPTLHGYADHYFVVLHTPLLGHAGHVHLLEIDQVVGSRMLVTVHGPLNPVLDPAVSLVETDGVLHRIEEGRFRPSSPAELSYAIGTAVARRQREVISRVAEKVPGLEQRVMANDFREPESLLEDLFLIRHELLTARTMAAQTHDVYARITGLAKIPPLDREYAVDLSDQFDRVRSVADGESQFLLGVIDLYQTRVTTKMTVAMERLAVIAAVTLPVTAIASVYGMNVIVNDNTHVTQLLLVLAAMAVISGWLLAWTRRQGWW